MRAKKGAWVWSVLVICICSFFVPFVADAGVPNFAEEGAAEAEMVSDADSEKFRELFRLYSEIELMESRREKTLAEIEELERKVVYTERQLAALEERTQAALAAYAEMLRIRQMQGEGRFVRVLLQAADLKDFLNRLNLTGNLSRAYDRAVADLDAMVSEQEAVRERMLQMKRDAIAKTQELENGIAEKTRRAKALEDYLMRLGEDRSRFEDELRKLSEKWSRLKPLFRRTVDAFVDLIRSGGLPDELIEIKVSLAGVRGIVREEVFNAMLRDAFRGRTDVTEMHFSLKDQRLYIDMPEYEVQLVGTMRIEGASMVYLVEKGSFYGIDMGEAAVEDLFMGGKLTFDLSDLLELMNLRIDECIIRDGYLDIGLGLQF